MQYGNHDFLRDTLERMSDLSDVVARADERDKAAFERIDERIDAIDATIQDIKDAGMRAMERRRVQLEGRNQVIFAASLDFLKMLLVLVVGLLVGHYLHLEPVSPGAMPTPVPRISSHP